MRVVRGSRGAFGRLLAATTNRVKVVPGLIDVRDRPINLELCVFNERYM